MKKLLFVLFFLIIVKTSSAQLNVDKNSNIDARNWRPSAYDDDFFKDHSVNGITALNYWMQSYNWRSNPKDDQNKRSKAELLLSGDQTQIALVNKKIQQECQKVLSNVGDYQAKNAGGRDPNTWIELSLRFPDKLTGDTKVAIVSALQSLNISGKGSGYVNWLNTPGSNGSNVHGYLTPLALAPALIKDQNISNIGKLAINNELDFMNKSGDGNEFNLLESHWTGVASWNVIKKYDPDPVSRRMARLIAERLWINRFLTWSSDVQRNTGPGSRMAPGEWLGGDNERALFATGIDRPIWLNLFFQWDANVNPRALHQTYEVIPTEMGLPDLPSYLQDIAWKKSLPNLLQSSTVYKTSQPYPLINGMPKINTDQPHKYVNYQTGNYTLGSVTASWVANTSVLVASAWWNSSRSPNEPVGSPKRFSVLYPHYVINGMAIFDKNDVFFEGSPGKSLSDDRGGPGGPWLREFADYGRAGTLQNNNTLLISYTPKPGSRKGQDFVKSSVTRASAGMFLYRWDDGLDGLFINRSPVKSLPAVLKPGQWWFIQDGDVYAAVLPLATTCIKGNCKITLEKRNHQIALYADNVADANIEGISDADWYKAQSGFVVEMGNKEQYGSFGNFQEKLIAANVKSDEAADFTRNIAYKRDNTDMEMSWNSYSEEYNERKLNGLDDKWLKGVSSPEFATGSTGTVNVKDASVRTTDGKTLWVLSCKPSKAWVAYQTHPGIIMPIDFKSPICEITTAQMPAGKIVVQQLSDSKLEITIDANYFAGENFNGGASPINIQVNNAIININFSINGVKFDNSLIKKSGPGRYTVNPVDKLQQIKMAP